MAYVESERERYVCGEDYSCVLGRVNVDTPFVRPFNLCVQLFLEPNNGHFSTITEVWKNK